MKTRWFRVALGLFLIAAVISPLSIVAGPVAAGSQVTLTLTPPSGAGCLAVLVEGANFVPDTVVTIIADALPAGDLRADIGEATVGNDGSFTVGEPADIGIAGDADDLNAPTYATFGSLMDRPAVALGTTIVSTVDRAGQVGTASALSDYGVTAASLAQETGHTVTSVFLDFMTSAGLIYEIGAYGGSAMTGDLFPNPFYATGLPITEAYWVRVRVAGVEQDVLVQAFERRVLTYTPANAAGWQDEAGNVGRHYYQWRYGSGVPQGVLSSRRHPRR